MYLILLDDSLMRRHVISIFESLIWTERFQKAGDFQLTLSMGIYPQNWFLECPFVMIDSSTELMETQKITVSVSQNGKSQGDTLKIEGVGAVKSILNRRIIWESTYAESLGDMMSYLLDENVISPQDERRKISIVTRFAGMEDELNKIPVEPKEYWGSGVYDALADAVKNTQAGLSMSVDLSDPQAWFCMYVGNDRTRDNKDKNTPVIFSEKTNRVLNTNYALDLTKNTTVALVAGGQETDPNAQNVAGQTTQDRDSRRPTLEVSAPDVENGGRDLFRHEIFVDASSITHVDNAKKKKVTAEYTAKRTEAQKEKAAEAEKKQLARIAAMRNHIATRRVKMTKAQREAKIREARNAAANEALAKIARDKAAKAREVREKKAMEMKYIRSDDEYAKLLTNEAYKKFDADAIYESMDGEIARMLLSEYGDTDKSKYYLGDLVTVEDKYGNRKDCYITEFIRSQNASGYEEYPTFSTLDDTKLVKINHSKVRKI